MSPSSPESPTPESSSPGFHAHSARSAPAAPLSVLLIEDAPGDARLFGEYLRESATAATLRHEETLQAGLGALSEERPDVLVVDLGLPDSTGTETVTSASAAATAAAPEVPIVVLTGQDDLQAALEAQEAGAAEYLQKEELTPTLVGRTLRWATQRRRMQAKLRQRDAWVRSMTERLSTGIFRVGPGGRVQYANTALAEMLGFESEEGLIGRDLTGFYADAGRQGQVLPEEASAEKALAEEATAGAGALAGEGSSAVEIEFEAQDGSSFVALLSARGAYDAGGAPLHYDGTVSDITERKKKEQRLRMLAEAVGQAKESVVITEAAPMDEPGPRIQYVNSAYEEMTGYSEEELVGKTPRVLQGPETERDVIDSLREALEAGEKWEGETVNYRKDGTPYRVQWNVAPVRNRDGTPGHWVSTQRDVTEEREREETLRRQKSLLEQAQRLAGAWEVDLRSGEGTGSKEVRRILEIEDDVTLSTEEGFQFFASEARQRIQEAFQRCIEAGEPYDLELPIITAEGNRRWVRAVGGPAETEGGAGMEGEEVTKVAGALQDITRRKEEERRRRQVIERVTDAIVEVDSGWRFTLVNDQAEALYGMAEEELLGEGFWAVFGEAEGTRFEEEYRGVMKTREPTRFEEHYPGLDGWFDVQVYPNEDGGVAFYFKEITERRRRKEKLERQNDLFEKAQEIADVGAWEYDAQADEATWTEKAYRIAGHPLGADPSPENTLGLYHPEDRPRVRDALGRAFEEGESFDLEVRITSLEEERWVRVRGEPQRETETGQGEISEGEVARVRGTIQDITEQKTREQRRRERQEKVEALYEATNQLLRAEGKEVLGSCLVGLVDETFDYAGTAIRFAEDGRLVPAKLFSTLRAHMPERRPYDLEGDAPVARAYRSGQAQVYDDLREVESVADRGDIRAAAYVPMGSYGTLSVGSLQAGGIAAFDRRLIEVMADYATLVLDRLGRESTLREAKKAAEKARREAEVANRTKSVFLANMSHEIRTPLTSILGFAEAIGEEVEATGDSGLDLSGVDIPALRRFAGLIENSGERLMDTLTGVLNLSKLQAGEMELSAAPVDLSDQATQAVEEFQPQADENKLQLFLQSEDSPVLARADAQGVQIVLRNLVSNAIKYTEEGEVRVRVWQDGDAACLEVEDTGIGMDPETVENLFEPFRQESEGLGREYEGTGLGLAVISKAIDQMDGAIEVETEKGTGSCFIVRLPTSQAEGSASGSQTRGS